MKAFHEFLLEGIKKEQINRVFANKDFKIGLEFEFYNEDFVRENNRPSTKEVLVMADYVELINETKKQNVKIVMKNKTSKASPNRKIITPEQIMDDFSKANRSVLFGFFKRNGINEKELVELTYRYINSALEKSEKYMAHGDFRRDIFEKYAGENKVLQQYMNVIIKAVQTEGADIDKEILKYYKKDNAIPSFIRDYKVIAKGKNSDPTKWTILPDLSVLSTLGGIEFVSPVMTPEQTLKATDEMFKYIRKVGNTQSHHTEDQDGKGGDKRNAQCGLHINISTTPERMKEFDPVKFIIYSNEGQFNSEKLFGDRKDADYIGSVLSDLRKHYKRKVGMLSGGDDQAYVNTLIKNKMFHGVKYLQSLTRFINDKYSNVNLQNYSFDNASKRRSKSERIEVRYFGGQDYEKKFETFRRVLGELLYALEVATDPELNKNDYQKKLYKLLSSGADDKPKLSLTKNKK